jgi:hypothetical protein
MTPAPESAIIDVGLITIGDDAVGCSYPGSTWVSANMHASDYCEVARPPDQAAGAAPARGRVTR